MQTTHTIHNRAQARRLLSLLSIALIGLLPSGCGNGLAGGGAAAPVTGPVGHTTLGGKVYGGQNPVNGAVVQLYAVGMTGYTSSAVPLISAIVKTDATGSYSITGDYTCPTGSYVYATATGGDAGAGSDNNNLALAAALGSCSVLKTNLPIVNINEVTTVAAAYALAQFSGGSSFGTTLHAQPGVSGTSAPADNFATSAANTQGLINAMNVAQLLADTSFGTSPGSNANGTASAEWWQVNTIANILATCVNSTGGVANDGSTTCGTLFGNVPVPSGTNPATGTAYAAPADTFQAAVYLALHPAVTPTQLTNLYGLASTVAPFQPYVAHSTDITDFSIAVKFTPVSPTGSTVLLNQPSWVSVDSHGNAWIGSQTTAAPYSASLLELDPTGNPVKAGTATGTAAANYLVNTYSVGSTSTPLSGQYSSALNTAALGGYFQFAVDTNNNVWVPDATGDAVAKITGSSGAATANGGNANDTGGNGAVGTKLTTGSNPVTIAVDGANDVYFVMAAQGASGVTGSCSTTALGSNTRGWGGFVAGNMSSTIYGGVGNTQPYFMAIDGGTPDTAGGTAIPGAPFLWTEHLNAGTSIGPHITRFGWLYHNYTKSTGAANTQLCTTPLIDIAPKFTGSSAKVQVAPLADTPVSGDSTFFQDTPMGIAIDNAGAIWIANTKYIALNTTIFSSISKVLPNYGAAFTPAATAQANAAAGFTFSVFHNVGGLTDPTTGYGPTFLAIDGAGSVWFSLHNNGTSGNAASVGALTTSGAAISPSGTGGFQGSSCVSCTFNGGAAATYSRYINTPSQLAVDPSGNVWIPMAGTGSTSVSMLVGAATPVVTPLALGVKNNSLGTKP